MRDVAEGRGRRQGCCALPLLLLLQLGAPSFGASLVGLRPLSGKASSRVLRYLDQALPPAVLPRLRPGLVSAQRNGISHPSPLVL